MTPQTQSPRWTHTFGLVLATTLLSASAFAAPKAGAKATTPAKAEAANVVTAKDPGKPLAFIKGIYAQLNTIAKTSSKKKILHKRIGGEMSRFMDYHAMGRRTLGKKTWTGLSEAQRTEFVGLLSAMVQKTFVKRFKPGTKVTITYAPKVRMKKDGRAQVRTTIRVKRTSASVYYSMIVKGGAWRVYDIIVDDVSQLATYKRSFRKILAKEGWKGLVARMKKST